MHHKGAIIKKHQVYILFVFAGIFGLGTLYTNCGQVDSTPQVRQKIFIDEVQDIYPQAACANDEPCSRIEVKSDGSYDLKPVNLR